MIHTLFEGIRILDLSQGIAGPMAAGILARQGATVIKVEPLHGDWVRPTGASRDGMSAIATACNFNKRSLAIDALHPAGRATLRTLALRADVVLDNFRSGVTKKLGLDRASLSDENPRLITCSITGFGEVGPWAKKAATDSVVQAFSGMAVANGGSAATPRRIGLYVPDNISAIYAAQAISGALFARERSGQGRHLALSLAECCAAFQSAPIADQALFPDPASKVAVFAPAGEFQTRDGWMVVAVMSGEMFARLARAVGREQWLADARYADSDVRKKYLKEINAELNTALRERTSAEWTAIFDAAEVDVLASPIHDYNQMRNHPQTVAMEMFSRLQQPPYGDLAVPHLPVSTREITPAPRVGEHSRELLAEAGMAAAEINALIAAGVVRQFEVGSST